MRRTLAEIRPLLALALPIASGQLGQMLIGITDSLMIGHVGAVPLAAAAFGNSVFNVFYVLGIGLMMPVAVFVAHAQGAARPADAGEYMRHGLALAFASGLVETLAITGIATQLRHFGQPSEVLAIVTPFFLLIGGSITPVLAYLVFRQYAEAMGRPWAPMLIMFGSVGLNVLLNWILIYGHWGAPALGLTGAGVATLISRGFGAVGLFAWVRRDPLLNRALPPRWFAPLSRERLREMLHLGLPAAGMLLFESGAFTGAAIMMGWLGAVPLAAHQIALTCAATTFMFPLGLSMAAGIRVSAAVGAGERHRLRPIGAAALGAGMALMGVFMISFLAAGRLISGWFVHEAGVIALATRLLVVAALFQLFDGVQVISSALLRGLKDVKLPAFITFVAYWILALGAGYALGLHTALAGTGVWIGLAAGLGFAAVFLALRFRALTAPVKPPLESWPAGNSAS